jgi:adenylate cyclase
MSADPDQEHFSAGLSDDLITELAKVPGLAVAARSSVFAYKGTPVNVQTVGRDLGVRCILEGSVRKAGQRIRVTAQLSDVVTGHHVWAERYDRELDDVFAIQDELVAKIVGDLIPKLPSHPDNPRASSVPPTASPGRSLMDQAAKLHEISRARPAQSGEDRPDRPRRPCA